MDDSRPGRSFVRKERQKARRSKNAGRAPPPQPAGRQAGGRGAPPERGPDRARIVVPRQERGAPERTGLDIELREVRYGTTARGPYLRVVPRKRAFVKQAPGHIEATPLASRPRRPLERVVADVKRVALGTPLATSQLLHERLTKIKALAVLGSDPLSSSAYATEEALLILALAGAAGLRYALPIGLVIAAVMAIVVISYMQTQRAYPSGGGAYIVAHENLGRYPGLTAGAALIVDYVLLVSVSVSAGVAAITSAVPELLDWRVPISVSIILLFTWGNLRGTRESGTMFAAPTYFFILTMGGVVTLGLVKVFTGDAPGSVLHAAPPREEVIATQGVTLWLVFRAFSSGGAALTGVEAMSTNVPLFKAPESTNAIKTLGAMAVIAIYLFVGITFLSSRYGLVPAEDETVVSQLGRAVLPEDFLYYALQAATALVLFLAANTSFYGFPLLSAVMARDKYMPRQFSFRGDRLAYSNGILVLAATATLLIVVFGADVSRLIPLYAVGVFVSFTLSQSGMVSHWLKLKERGWQFSLVLNGAGAATTGVVAVIIAATKFTHGAWISIAMMVLLVAAFTLVFRHYRRFQERIRVDERELPVHVPLAVPMEPGGPREHVIVPVDGVNKITLAAVGMAREISSAVTAVHLTDDAAQAEKFREEWARAVPDVPLLIIESPYRAFVAPVVAYIEDQLKKERYRMVVILPSFVAHHWWERLLHNRDIVRLKPFLTEIEGLRVVDFPYDLEQRSKRRPPGGAHPVRVRR